MRKMKLVTLSTLLTLAMLGATANAQPVSMAPAPAMAPAATPSPAPVAPYMASSPAPAMASPAPAATPSSGAMAPAPAMSTPAAMTPASPAPAPAAQPAKAEKTDPWWKVLLGGLLQILLLFVLTFATIAGRLLIKYIAKKMNVTDKEEIERMNALYDSAVTIGVNFASQQAHKLRDKPDSKGKRLDWALTKAQELIKDYKLPEKTAQWITDKIEAKIGEKERDKPKLISGELVTGETDKPEPDAKPE